MTAIIDYGVGNLFSLCSSFAKIGAECVVTSDESEIKTASRIILPGVGAFRDAASKLKSSGLDKVVLSEIEKGKPVMGICLGMQMLFDRSFEFGEYDGLGIIPGDVVGMDGRLPEGFKIPHIGWNKLDVNKDSRLFKYIKNGDYVYFVHSFYAETDKKYIGATTDYGKPLTAFVEKDNVFGCQFHPEKSGQTGLSILKAFCEL